MTLPGNAVACLLHEDRGLERTTETVSIPPTTNQSEALLAKIKDKTVTGCRASAPSHDGRVGALMPTPLFRAVARAIRQIDPLPLAAFGSYAYERALRAFMVRKALLEAFKTRNTLHFFLGPLGNRFHSKTLPCAQTNPLVYSLSCTDYRGLTSLIISKKGSPCNELPAEEMSGTDEVSLPRPRRTTLLTCLSQCPSSNPLCNAGSPLSLFADSLRAASGSILTPSRPSETYRIPLKPWKTGDRKLGACLSFRSHVSSPTDMATRRLCPAMRRLCC